MKNIDTYLDSNFNSLQMNHWEFESILSRKSKIWKNKIRENLNPEKIGWSDFVCELFVGAIEVSQIAHKFGNRKLN
jgi:hypothetical protein